MRLTFKRVVPKRFVADAVVLLRWQDTLRAAPGAGADPADKLAAEWIRHARYHAKVCETAFVPTWGRAPSRHFILAGLGRRDDFHPGVLRRALAAASRLATRHRCASLLVRLDLPWRELALDQAQAVRLAALGLHEGTYTFRAYVRHDPRETAPLADVVITIPRARPARALDAAAREGALTGVVINATRDLANHPGNVATPVAVAGYARRLARRSGLRFDAWGRDRLEQQRCRALLAVAQGSREEPRLVTLRYPGRRPGLRPVVLVGKTITFDSGGLSIKPAKSMEWMKYDKSGGMTVLAVMEMVGRLLKPDFPVVGILAMAENMPGGGATRPGDIVHSRDGKSIEIINTDAEGRLVLADALSVARGFKPACIVDLATLTGAAVIALGHVVSAVLGNRTALVDDLMASGQATGDRLWPMPLHTEYAAMLNSPFADLKNTGDGTAGTIAGAMFLKYFVDPRTPWAHIDLTTAWEERDLAHSAAGATLFGTALLCDWIRRGGPALRPT